MVNHKTPTEKSVNERRIKLLTRTKLKNTLKSLRKQCERDARILESKIKRLDREIAEERKSKA